MLICLQRMDRKNINADRREKGSGLYFSVFGPEKTPYLDNFHAVDVLDFRVKGR